MAAIQLIDPEIVQFNTHERLYHDGIELEKGVVITSSFLEKNEDLIAESIQLFTAYPDIFLDLITPLNSNFKLFPYQRIFLRACMRYTKYILPRPAQHPKLFFLFLQNISSVSFFLITLGRLSHRINSRPRKSVSKRQKKFGVFGLYQRKKQIKLTLVKTMLISSLKMEVDYLLLVHWILIVVFVLTRL